MHNDEKTGLGIHFGIDGVRASLASGGLVSQLISLEPIATYLAWVRLPSGDVACAAAPQFIGVEGKDTESAKALSVLFRQLKAVVEQKNLGVIQVTIAVPRALSEPQRRRLLANAREVFKQVSLIDSTTAVLYALSGTIGGDGATVTAVAEDIALEICASATDTDGYSILGYRDIPNVGVNALYHHLFQQVVDRLPATVHGQLSLADDDTLSTVFRRVVRAGAVLARLGNMTLSLSELGSPPPAVTITTNDVETWLEARQVDTCSVMTELAAEIQAPVARIVLVGNLGEWPSFVTPLEANFGQPLIYGLECVADGAALAAASAVQREEPPIAPGPLIPMAKAISGFPAYVIFGGTGYVSKYSPEQLLQDFFGEIAKLVAQGNCDRVSRLLSSVKHRANAVLAALTDLVPSVHSEVRPSLPTVQHRKDEVISGDGRVEIVLEELSSTARRGFEEAERLLRLGRVLEAVNASHRAHESGPNSHDGLIYMLDIHRRGAKILTDNGNFEMAKQQLRCALQHRQGDERTRRALGDVLLAEASYQENVQRDNAKAENLYCEALEYVDDDAVAGIQSHRQRLIDSNA